MLESGKVKMDFEWDRAKAQSNTEKHGISFLEAITVFGDPFEITISDPDHFRGRGPFSEPWMQRAGPLAGGFVY